MKANAENVIFKSGSDNWKTPEDIYKQLYKEFCFDFDPCPLNSDIDNLHVEWGKSNFVNPPYSNIGAWVEKCYLESKKGKTVVLLIPSRTDTKYWHDCVMKAKEIRFCRGRLKFSGSKNNAPFPSCIVIF